MTTDTGLFLTFCCFCELLLTSCLRVLWWNSFLLWHKDMISPSISQAIIKMTPWPFLFMTLGTDWQVFFNQQLADNWLKEMNSKSNVPQTLSFAQLAQLSTMWRNSNVDGWWLAVVGCILELGKVRPVVLVFVPSIEIYSCNVQLRECCIIRE